MALRRIATIFSVLWACCAVQAQVSVAQSTPFTSATTVNTPDTAFKVQNGSFIPLFAETKEPTVFDISEDDSKYISKLTLPKGSAFGGIQFNTPGVKGWSFPKAESDITIILGNNNTTEVRRVTVSIWKNPSKLEGPPLAPVKAGTIYLDIVPTDFNPVPKPFPKPKPGPDGDGDLTPITYTGKQLLCIFEQSEQATAQRGQFLSSPELRAFLGTILKKHFDHIDVSNVPQSLKPYHALIGNNPMPYYFLVAADGPQAGTILRQGSISPTMTPSEFITKLK